MNDKWMKDLKDLSGSYQKKAPEGLLDDIKREMSRRGVMPASEKKKAPAVPMKLWKRAAAVIAVLIVSGVAVNQLMNDGIEEMPEVAEVATPLNNDNNSETNVEQTPPIQPDEPLLASADDTRRNAKKNVPSYSSSVKADNEWIAPTGSEQSIEEPIDVIEASKETQDTVAVQSQKNDEPSPSKDQRESSATSHEQEYLAMTHLPTRHRKQTDRSWGIGAYYGGGGNISQGGDMDINDNVPQSNPIYVDPDNPGGIGSGVDYGNEQQIEDHNLPVKFGISVRYRLNDRWSLQSGLTYSYLNSELSSWKGSRMIVTDQKLHYMGIPLTVNYNIWQNKHVNLYLGAGGEIEKLVKGTQLHGADKQTKPWTEKVSENAPIFSTNASAGVELLMGNYFSIYAEPGASYHFDNGSSVHSYYTDDPLNFNINIGLRINFNK